MWQLQECWDGQGQSWKHGKYRMSSTLISQMANPTDGTVQGPRPRKTGQDPIDHANKTL